MDINRDLVKKVEKIIGETFGYTINEDDLVYMVEELVSEVERLEEELEDEKEQRENYYKPKSEYELLGMSERDFI